MAANAKFLKDATIPDNTAILAGTSFTKTWLVQNTGDVPWTSGYQLAFSKGTNLAATEIIPLPACAPKDKVQISLAMTAPDKAGKCTSRWVFKNPQGKTFGDQVYVTIKVMAVTTPVGQNNSFFVEDITIPDGSTVQAGAQFVKTWRIRNNGVTAWNDNYTLTQIDGHIPSVQNSVPLPPVAPGGEANISVTFIAPQQAGRYSSDWKMSDDSGKLFGAQFWANIVVPGKEIAPEPVVTPPLQAPAPFYSQIDPRWGALLLGNVTAEKSIARWGCMLTCYAMLASKFGDVVDPNQLNDLMIQRGGFTSGFYTRYDALERVFSDIHFDAILDAAKGQDLLTGVNKSLNAGIPVPVRVDITPATAYSGDNDQHWVLVVGFNGDQDYWVNNPIEHATFPTSLMQKYGKRSGRLFDSILAATFFHKV